MLLLFTVVIIYYASRRKLLADVVCVSEWEIARSSSFQAFYADFGDYSEEKERERETHFEVKLQAEHSVAARKELFSWLFFIF